MTMETRKHLAAEKNRKKTHNCAQAVLCTYCDICGLDPKTAEDIAGSFGLGMGNMDGTCGSLVGAGMALGLVTKDRDLARKRIKQIMEKFRAAFFKVYEMPEVQEAIAKTGVVPHPSSAADAESQVQRELKDFDVILREVGIKK